MSTDEWDLDKYLGITRIIHKPCNRAVFPNKVGNKVTTACSECGEEAPKTLIFLQKMANITNVRGKWTCPKCGLPGLRWLTAEDSMICPNCHHKEEGVAQKVLWAQARR